MPISLTGSAGNDVIVGGAGNDTLSGGGGNDTLDGNAGNDTLNGGAGVDVMTGGAGNDTYYVDNAGDQVIEAAGSGTDTVYAIISYTLAASQQIETLRVSGAAGLTLTGNEINNALYGGVGNDILNGGAGADTMTGGAGNDTYYIDNAGDVVTEFSNNGTDLVQSSINFSLGGKQVENLDSTGSANINGTGNSFVNKLIGNSGINILNGGSGSDTLTGLGGNDSFVFDTALGSTNVDTITDFNFVNDTIRLENAIFTTLVGTGTLTAAQFVANASGTAADSSDRIVYETDTGKLFYDSNGNAAGGAVQFGLLIARTCHHQCGLPRHLKPSPKLGREHERGHMQARLVVHRLMEVDYFRFLRISSTSWLLSIVPFPEFGSQSCQTYRRACRHCSYDRGPEAP